MGGSNRKETDMSTTTITRTQRYGMCDKKHALATIKSRIRVWAEEMMMSEQKSATEAEIKEIINDQLTALNDETACQWVICKESYGW